MQQEVVGMSPLVMDPSAWWGQYAGFFGARNSMTVDPADTAWAGQGITRIIQAADHRIFAAMEWCDYYSAVDEIALELLYNEERGVPGWVMRPGGADYLAYAWVTARACRFFPLPPLLRWFNAAQAILLTRLAREEDGYRLRTVQLRQRRAIQLVMPVTVIDRALGGQLR
jgi:hypothetical protein